MFLKGLEKREMIALVNDNYMFSVGFRNMPSGIECCANAVLANKSRHFAATSGDNMWPKHRTGRPSLASAVMRNLAHVANTLCQAMKRMLLRVRAEGPDGTSKRTL